MLRLALLLLAASTLAGAATPAADGPDALAERFARSWNAHSPADFGEYLLPDTDWVTASGRVLRGKTAISDYLANEHATWARTTTMVVTAIQSREISPGVVTVRLEWRIGSPGADGVEQSFPGVTQFVARRMPEGWRVVSGQVTSGRARAAT